MHFFSRHDFIAQYSGRQNVVFGECRRFPGSNGDSERGYHSIIIRPQAESGMEYNLSRLLIQMEQFFFLQLFISHNDLQSAK